MGLGKTLTMISLIMVDKQARVKSEPAHTTPQWLSKGLYVVLSGPLVVLKSYRYTPLVLRCYLCDACLFVLDFRKKIAKRCLASIIVIIPVVLGHTLMFTCI